MATVVVDDSCLKQADSQPKSRGLVWGSTAAWHCSTFIKWTEWTLAMTWSWWQHYKYCHRYYYCYYYYYYYDRAMLTLTVIDPRIRTDPFPHPESRPWIYDPDLSLSVNSWSLLCNHTGNQHRIFRLNHSITSDTYHRSTQTYRWCGLRPSVLGQDRSETKKIGLGLAGLMLCCETRSCHARRHNDLDGHSNFSSTICSFSILCLEHH